MGRRDAGRALALLLDDYRGHAEVIVLGLPRGGVPVAYEIARALGARLDVFLVRKLGVPSRKEFAMGAIASGGAIVLNEDVVRRLDITPQVIQQVAEHEAQELLRRERVYRDSQPSARRRGPNDHPGRRRNRDRGEHARGHPGVAPAPARPDRRGGADGPESTCHELTAVVDDVVCATTPSPFFAVGNSYSDFTQTTDGEVRDLLVAARSWDPGTTQVPLTDAQRTRADDIR